MSSFVWDKFCSSLDVLLKVWSLHNVHGKSWDSWRLQLHFPHPPCFGAIVQEVLTFHQTLFFTTHSPEFHEWLIHLNSRHGGEYGPYSFVPDPQISRNCEASAVRGWYECRCDERLQTSNIVVYYESIKREPKIKSIYECRCDERLQTKSKLNGFDFFWNLKNTEENKKKHGREQKNTEEDKKKVRYHSRFLRVILAQGPC